MSDSLYCTPLALLPAVRSVKEEDRHYYGKYRRREKKKKAEKSEGWNWLNYDPWERRKKHTVPTVYLSTVDA